MTENQYLRANKRVFTVSVIVFAYIALTVLAALAVHQGAYAGRMAAQCITVVGVIIVSVIAYITKKKTYTCAVVLVTAMTGGYAVVSLLNSTEGITPEYLSLALTISTYLYASLPFTR